MDQEAIQGFRLSPQQKHYWLLQKDDPHLPHSVRCAVLMAGDLEPRVLGRALRSLVERHEILRTSFTRPAGAGTPTQVIHAGAPLYIAEHDLSGAGPGACEAEIEKMLEEAGRPSSDAAQDSPLGLSLVRLSADRHALLVSLPALCADAASLNHLVRELGECYAACLGGEPLADEPMQYADIAEWQNVLLESEEGEVGRDFWRRKKIYPALSVSLPFEKRSAEKTGFRAASVKLTVEPELAAAIETTAEKYGAATPVLLLACWQVLLWRLTERADVVVGAASDGRNHPELRGALGLLAKYLPVQCSLEVDQRFGEALARVGASCREAQEWQESFSWDLVAESNGHLPGEPFFPFLFDFEEPPVRCEAAGLTLSAYKRVATVDRFKIKLSCARVGDSLVAEFHYDAGLFDAGEVERLASRYYALLHSIVADPETAVSRLQILPRDERRQLLYDFNEPTITYPNVTAIHRLFEQQVERAPGNVAVVMGEEEMTYGELNARANQLAHHLRALGVGPEVLVALMLERSPQLVVALLAVLKAGGAYLPLDPEYPAGRLSFMLADSGAAVLVTEQGLLARLPEPVASVVCLDTERERIARESRQDVECGVRPENLAYVIYTSGSTGLPKGVQVSHANVVRLFAATEASYGFGEHDVWTLFHSSAFDFSVWELWGALLYGGQLIVVPYWVSRTPHAFLELLAARQVTVLNQTPSAFRQLMQADESLAGGAQLALRLVIFGGEALELRSLLPWFERHGDERPQLVNMYGITETTVHTTYRPLLTADALAGRGSLIGRALSDLRVYILDEHQQPAPIGVAGELFVGGAGAARGYLKRPELTAERFIPDPFGGEPGARLYRSGDLARYTPDGDIEYLGRLDQQVKIRGFRIELGEIEAALATHPSVRECAVVARADASGADLLVAYVVGDGAQPPTAGEFHTHLKATLPDYMIPSAFVTLEELPVTANGKLDRRALPAPEEARLATGRNYVAPRTPTEELLAGVWAAKLGLSRVGVHDDFFELGGHSLVALQLCSRVGQVFNVELPVRSVFANPTIAQLSREIEELQRDGQHQLTPPIRPVGRDGGLPLSFAQQRLWFLDQLEPQSPYYNVPAAFRLRGHLNVAALEQTLNEVVRRHEVFRTSFVAVGGEARQFISPPGALPLPVEELSALAEGEREAEVVRLAAEEAARPFDFGAGQLLRVRLLRLSESEHVLLLTMHHIVSDGWSVGVLASEVTTLYRAYSSGAPSPLPELTIQYADYAVWQREWLQGEVLERQLAYWRQQLGSNLPVLELPTDRPRPPVYSHRGAHLPLSLSPELTAALKELSRREGVTLFMTLLAGFQLMLSRYSGQEDIVVGTDIANRNRGEVEGLIGFFANQLVLRTDLSGNPPARELLQRVRGVALAAYAHQDVPFERLVEELQPERDLGRAPLFQVKFILQNAPAGELELPGLTLSPQVGESRTSRFDLTLSMSEAEGGLAGVIEYSTDLFDEATIARMSRHLRLLLEGLAANVERPLADLPMLAEDERRRMLVEWNETGMDYPQDRCIHELFEEVVERAPDAAAVYFEDERLTYRELNERANQLAHHLRGLGVGPEVLVGLCVERSVEMVVGLLGILKAGGAYLPLDPSYPLERLSFMLEDSAVSILLAQEALADVLPTHWGHTLYLDADRDEIAQQSGKNPPREIEPGHLAYSIYTSGSTGKPKGTLISHRNLVHSTTARRAYYRQPVTNFLLLPSFAFDSSVAVIFWTLCAGGALTIPREGMQRDPSYLAELISRRDVTHYLGLPSLYNLLLEEAGADQLRTLRTVIVAGEACPRGLIDRHFGALPAARLFNEYGPTEATVWSTVYEFRADEPGAEVPIGRPIPNGAGYILDARLNPVPVGVVGELHIGGAGLGRGYLNRAELTAERFIPDPFGANRGARLYRTGDLARFTPDGNILFVGRRDQQVKVRGFRIELGEIEAVLRGHGGVRETAVIVREDAPGDKRLVAYLVVEDSQTATAGELRNYLRQRLPDYMIPSAFVTLEELPVTANGKLDRRALPAPDHSRSELDKGNEGTRTPVEEMLAGIWSEVLGVERVGVHDNFFELGGHSLLATQLISRAREAFKVELSLRAVFETPTVAGLSRQIEAGLQAGTGLTTAPILPVAREGAMPLSFAQQRLWFLDQLEPGSTVYNLPAAVSLKGRLSVEALQQTLDEIVRRHEILRTTFPDRDGQPVQHIAPPSGLPLRLVDLGDLTEKEREREVFRLTAEETTRPFNLAQGPLVRATLLRLHDEEHVIIFMMHHIVSDGWSLGILIEEVSTLYTAFAEDKPSPLPELTIQYADFAVWQRQWLTDEVLEQQLNYWRQQLADAPPLLELPTDHPRPAVQSFRGRLLNTSLPQHLTELLRAHSRREGVTLFMTLLAGFQTLLARYTGRDDISVGTPIANRNRGETERLIGFFVNTLVLRTDLSGDPTARQALARVREVTLGAYAHQDLPFERLVEELQPERGLSHSPLFQVVFSLENAPGGQIKSMPGLEVSEVEAEGRTSTFDLTWTITEEGDQLLLTVEYSTDLFEEATIRRMLGHFARLLEGFAADPDRRLSELPLLAEDEQHRALVEWNDTEADYPHDQCVHELFERQAARTPDALAVVMGEDEMSYGELNARANQLAHHLRALGVGPEVLVGLCVERSFEMLVGLLGILKAGGAYVPLDPEYPPDRLSFMIEDAAMPVLVTQQSLLDSLPANWAQLVCLDDDASWAQDALDRAAPPPLTVAPDNLAYVIYTSGSTGRPNGVMVSHRSLVNYVSAVSQQWGLGPADRVLQFASLSFDASAEEVYPCLLAGAALVLRTPQMLDSPSGFLTECRRSGVTVLDLPVAYWRELVLEVEAAQWARYSGLRLMVLGAEKPQLELLRRWWEVAGARVRLVNTYGPTEATIVATACELEEVGAREAPIGRPVRNVRAYILDGRGQAVPVGVAGELYLGGVGLARGYLNRPGLTSERFIADGYGGEAGGRLYRTGDLARYLPDGQIEFLGRIDHQVKLRGYRIELSEIEAVLCRHPAVEEAVVTMREDARGDKQLVAYVVAGRETGGGELRGFVKEKLPAYMIPSAFVQLEKLPLTANNKIDRRALPVPDEVGGGDESAYVAPRTPTEEVLAGIFADVLRQPQVSAQGDFFDLGGHSLLATQVASRVRHAFSVELQVRALFEAPTVVALARKVEELQHTARGPQAPLLVRRPRAAGEARPLSFAQQRLWFLDQLEGANVAYNIPSVVQLKGTLDASALEYALGEVVRRHEALRTTFPADGGRPRQVVAEQTAFRLMVSDLEHLPESERRERVREVTAEQTTLPFDLSAGPLIRAMLLRLSAEDHLLVLVLHHIVCDAWSMGVLVEEVAAIYEARARGGDAAALPELPLQYSDYAVWQREWLRGEVLEQQLNYWREQLAGVVGAMELPTDRPRPAVQSNRGEIQTFAVAGELSEALRQLSRGQGTTLFMTLLAAFKVVLSRFTGSEDIVVGTDVANRNREEVEGLIGFFVNQLVLRTQLGGDPTFLALLGRVREVTLGAYMYQDMPFDKVVEALRPERDLKQNPLFQVMFVFQNVPQPIYEVPGVTMRSVEVDNGTTVFDLTVYLGETEGGLAGSLRYNTDLFERDTINRLAVHLTTVLQNVASNPELRLSELHLLLDEADRHTQAETVSELEQVRLRKLRSIRRRAVGEEQAESQGV